MPTYDYQCRDCGEFELRRPIAARNQPAECPACGGAAARTLVAAPALARMAGGRHAAIARNERAANTPHSTARDGPYGRLRHPAGCGCCAGPARTAGGSGAASTGSGRATVRAADGAKAFPSRRPWMISH